MASNSGPDWGEIGFWVFLCVCIICATFGPAVSK